MFSAVERSAFTYHGRAEKSCDTDTHIYTRFSQAWKHGSGSGEPTMSAGMHRRVASQPNVNSQPTCVHSPPPRKLLSISPRCPFLLIQTFVALATTDAVPPQDFIHKHTACPTPPSSSPLSESSCLKNCVIKKAVWAYGKLDIHTRRYKKNKKNITLNTDV